MVVLGAMLCVGKATAREAERIQKAMACASKVAFLPRSPKVRAFVAMTAVASKAVYGWLARSPAACLVAKLETGLKQAHFNHRMASVDLTRLTLGHRLDILFIVLVIGGRETGRRTGSILGCSILVGLLTALGDGRVRRLLRSFVWNLSMMLGEIVVT